MQNVVAINAAAQDGIIAAQATSDETLLRSIAAGDRTAMQVIYSRHNLRVYRFILRIVRDASLAEDLTSQVFLDVWRTANQFEGRSQVSTWLLSIARFKALTALRQRRQEEHIQQRRGQQAAQYGHRHGSFDFLAGLVESNGQRSESQGGDRRGQQDGHQPFVGTSQHGIGTPGSALDLDQVLVM